MEKLINSKLGIITGIGVASSFLTTLFGGWDTALETLIIFMTLDYITGIAVAGVFNKSDKSDTGALESKAGFKGLCKKGIVLFMILIAHRLDMMMDSNFIRDAVVIAYIVNETISIIENAGLMGLPVPNVISNAIAVLKQNSEAKASK